MMEETRGQREVMIQVRGAFKEYSSDWDPTRLAAAKDVPHVALAGLDMTVLRGTIYTLLGPSGCGKTTLLSCIIGRRAMDAGEIKLGVQSCSQIGYMPQEVGLQEDLSIAENVAFYKRLFNLSDSHMHKLKLSVYEFLQLPSEDRVVGTLSGGQKRRVSLYVALLHDPELLVLDEPTVGLDPTLSHSIWEYFIHLTNNEKKTILITTHYIEEARKAHQIGMMRKGVILEEGNPQQLMHHYNTQSLDELFLKISMKQGSARSLQPQVRPMATSGKQVKSPLKSDEAFSLHRYWSQLMNNVHWTMRNKPVIASLLLLPFFNCLIFDFSIGRRPEVMMLGLVNEEPSYGREACQDWTTSCFQSNYTVPLSCGYLEALGKYNIDVVYYSSVEEARRGVLQSQVWGYLHVPSNYTMSLLNRLEYNLKTQDDDVIMSEIEAQMDISNHFFYSLLTQDMYRSYIKFLEKLHENCNWPVAAAGIPIQTNTPLYGEENISYSEFTLPCIIELSIYFLPLIHILAIVISEKRQGLWERYFVSGMNIAEVITGHITMTLVVLFLQVALVMILLFCMLGHSINGSSLLFTLLVFVIGIGGISFGVMISSVFKSEYGATFVGFGSYLCYSFISGMLWPYEGMHVSLQKVCWYLPLTITSESLRSIAIKGWGISYPAVYNGFLTSFVWILLYGIGSFFVFRGKKSS